MGEDSKPDPLHALMGMRDFLVEYCADAIQFMTRCLGTPAANSRLPASLKASKHDYTYVAAWQHLLVGADHLQALVQTLHGGPERLQIPQAACFTLERGCLESSAFAVWLLDQTISESVSVSRGLMAQVRNLRESQKIEANELSRDDALRQIKSVARANGLRIELKGKYPTKIGQTADKSATEACSEALALIHTPEEDYRLVYQLLSGYAHGLGYALLLNVTATQTVDRLKLLTIASPVEWILLCGIASARVHHKALELLGHHAGLSDVPPAVDERQALHGFRA